MKKFLKSLAAYSLCLSVIASAGCAFSSNSGSTDGGQDNPPIDDLLNEKYSVTTSVTGEGTVSASASEVQFGETVTFTFSAASGYVLASVTINGNEVDVDGDTFSIPGAMRDYDVQATFVQANVTVSFTGEGVGDIDDMVAAYGKKLGDLPTPEVLVGKRFLGWKNAAGEIVTKDTVVTTVSGSFELTATWESIDVDTTLYQPFSISTAYHDMSATNYGIVWHTRTAPASSVVYVSKGETVDVETARVIQAK